MVVLDASVLLLLLYPNASPPIDSSTGLPVTRCRERIELLLESLSKGHIAVMVPTPVLSEILVTTRSDMARVLAEISNTWAFHIEPFDERAAVEVALMTDPDLQSNKLLTENETRAKIKFDRQIIAIAKVNGVKTIYSSDNNLRAKAEANGITAVGMADLPLPPEPPQAALPLPPVLEGGSW